MNTIKHSVDSRRAIKKKTLSDRHTGNFNRSNGFVFSSYNNIRAVQMYTRQQTHNPNVPTGHLRDR